MHNSPVKTTARYLPGSPCYSQASEVAMEPEKKEDEENENKGEKENEENEDKEEEQEEEEQQPLEKPASKAKAGSKPKVPKTPPKTFKGKKPKPKAKAKGSAKDKKEKKQKGKKEKKNEKEDTPAPFKRPAAKGGTRDQVSKLQSGVPEAKEEVEKVEGEEEKEEEEEVREQDECVDPDGHNEKRSKGSGGKFNRLLKAGKVPAQIKEIWKKSETREEKTMLVDCLLQEELQDRLLGNAGRQSQLQKLAEETSDKSFGKDAQASFPRAIMLHHYFHGDADAFNQALASGDITGVNQGGKVMYRFDTYEVEGPKNQTKESTNG